jgi:hypothetical protein
MEVQSELVFETSSESPFSLSTPKTLLMKPLRISPSINNIFLPASANTAARLMETKVIQTPGLGPVIMIMLFCASKKAKCKVVRKLRKLSMARSSLFCTAKIKGSSLFRA